MMDRLTDRPIPIPPLDSAHRGQRPEAHDPGHVRELRPCFAERLFRESVLPVGMSKDNPAPPAQPFEPRGRSGAAGRSGRGTRRNFSLYRENFPDLGRVDRGTSAINRPKDWAQELLKQPHTSWALAVAPSSRPAQPGSRCFSQDQPPGPSLGARRSTRAVSNSRLPSSSTALCRTTQRARMSRRPARCPHDLDDPRGP
jgi:hypothetical protein